MIKRSIPFVIAEIGCNHMGDVEIAKKLIDAAVASGCSAAKFQKRNVKECLPPEIYNGPHRLDRAKRNQYQNQEDSCARYS